MSGQLKKTTEIVGGHRDAIRDLAICVEKNVIATAAGDKLVIVRNLDTGRVLRMLWSPQMDITSVAISADGHWLAAAGDGGTLLDELYPVSTGPADSPTKRPTIKNPVPSKSDSSVPVRGAAATRRPVAASSVRTR